jgi:hypothetical protein
MSTPREFWLKVHKCDPAFDVFESEVSQTKPDFAKMMWHDFKDSIHVIEKTPEVVRKLECFDELVKALEFYADEGNWQTGADGEDSQISDKDLTAHMTNYIAAIGGKLARETLKKAKGE